MLIFRTTEKTRAGPFVRLSRFRRPSSRRLLDRSGPFDERSWLFSRPRQARRRRSLHLGAHLIENCSCRARIAMPWTRCRHRLHTTAMLTKATCSFIRVDLPHAVFDIRSVDGLLLDKSRDMEGQSNRHVGGLGRRKMLSYRIAKKKLHFANLQQPFCRCEWWRST